MHSDVIGEIQASVKFNSKTPTDPTGDRLAKNSFK